MMLIDRALFKMNGPEGKKVQSLRKYFSVTLMFLFLLVVAGCQDSPPVESEPEGPEVIKLATTTSLDNSGLLGEILPVFTGETGIEVDVIAVGTGAALELGQAGDVDIVLVHAPGAEKEFIAEGYGTTRHYIAQNEFVIVGPASDPAGIASAESVTGAFELIGENQVRFVSRGDNSGTHKRELIIWDATGLDPAGEWYIEAGQGMGAVLNMAGEMEAYTLTDIGTFYSMIDNLDLEVLNSGDPMLENIYSIIPLNPEKHPDLNHDAAGKLVEWITGDQCGKLICDFKVNGYTLFDVRAHDANSPDMDGENED